MNSLLSLEYPSFASSQTLRSSDLNALRNFLSRQNLETRTGLIGVGILAGLELSVEKEDDNSIVLGISKGIGVSSERPAEKDEPVNKQDTENSRPADSNLFIVKKDISIRSYRRLSEDRGKQLDAGDIIAAGTNSYEFSENELLPDSGDWYPISHLENIQDIIVFLFQYADDVTTENCASRFNPNATRLAQRCVVIGLELKEDDVNRDDLWIAPASVEKISTFPFVDRVPKKPMQSKSGEDEATALWNEWKDAVEKALSDENADSLYNMLAGVVEHNMLKAWKGNIENIIEDWFDTDTITTLQPAGIQYVHEHLQDIICAFNELAAFYFQPVYCQESFVFPNYLSLGSIKEPVKLRMPFYRVGSIDDDPMAGKYEHYKARLEGLLDHFDIGASREADEPVRITGSGMKSEVLDKQAIPFYYKEALKKFWNFELWKTGRYEAIQQYEERTPAKAHPRQALRKDMIKYPFFRIEGHLGMDAEAGVGEIRRLQEQLNLPFQVICVPVKGPASDGPQAADVAKQPANYFGRPGEWGPMGLKEFCTRYPGLEHQGGVQQGGTFVLVFDERVEAPADGEGEGDDEATPTLSRPIIADFSLPPGAYVRGAPMADFDYSVSWMTSEDPQINEDKVSLKEEISSPLARVEIVNRSTDADITVWDVAEGVPEDYYAWIETAGTWIGYFDLNKLAAHGSAYKSPGGAVAIRARLTASDIHYPESQFAQWIALCPLNMMLVAYGQNDKQSQARTEIKINKKGLTKIQLQIDPLGGTFEVDDALKEQLTGLEKTTVSHEEYIPVVYDDTARKLLPGRYPITYSYPGECNLKEEIFLVLDGPWADCEIDNIQYMGFLDEAMPAGVRRALEEKKLSAPFARVEILNKSMAHTIEWKVSHEGDGEPWHIERADEIRLIGYFDLNQVQNIIVEVTAYMEPHPPHTKKTVPFNICPKDDSYELLIEQVQDDGSVLPLRQLDLVRNQVMNFALVFKPAGGWFTWPEALLPYLSDASRIPDPDGTDLPGLVASGEKNSPIALQFFITNRELRNGGEHKIQYHYPSACSDRIYEVLLKLDDVQGGEVPAEAGETAVDKLEIETSTGRSTEVLKDGGPDDSEGASSVLIPDRSVLNKRRQAYFEQGQALGEGGLGQTQLFKKAMSFLMLPPAPENLDQTLKAFDALVKSLVRAINRKNNPNKRKQEALLQQTTVFLLDKLIAESPAVVPDSARESLKKAVAAMKKAKLKLNTVRTLWKPAELKHPLTKQYLDLLK
ncbi:MAG: hypothetical protein AAF564_16085 [Bacteroidota bacterium]